MRIVFSILFLFLSTSSFAQKELTLKDAVLQQYRDLAPDRLWGLQWVSGTDAYVYQKAQTDGVFLIKETAKGGEAQKLFSLDDLNAGLGTQLRYIPGLDWQSEDRFTFHAENGFYSYNTSNKTGKGLFKHDPDAANVEAAPNYRAAAYTINNNLHLKLNTGDVVKISDDENPGIVTGQAVHRYEFGITKGIFWGPNSTKLAFYRKDETMVSDYPLVDISTTPASVKNIKYPMAGQASHHATVGVYNLTTKKTTWLKTGEPKELYLTCVSWSPDEKFVYLATVNRDQNHVKLNKYDAESGKLVATLFEEKDEKYVEPEHELTFLPNNSDQFIWWSERDGWNHLYLYSTSGKLIRQLTKGQWEVENIIGFGPKGRFLYVQGTANHGLDRQVYKVDTKSGKTVMVTKASGTHVAQLSPSGNYLIDQFTSLNIPRKTQLISSGGKVIRDIHIAENPLKNLKIGTAEIYSIEGKDGNKLHCRMIKPSNFDPSKKYPVLVYAYGGPRFQLVKNSWIGGANLWMYWMAEQGYIVFSMDNRGSENRGLAFEQAVFRNLGKYEMEDQLTGADHLKSLPYVDGNRLAIHGWSFGGYLTTTLMLKSPDTYQVGVAGGPVTDWAYYEIMYGEKYMDHPDDNKEGYKNGQLKNYVKGLKGDLLLIHGAMDATVVLQHNYAFLQECVNQDVQVDYFVYPGHEHNVRGKDRYHLMHKVLQYIIDKND